MIPTRQTIGVRRWSSGGRDRHGNPLNAWADPVDVPVHGVSPRFAEEPTDPNRHAVVRGLTVYAPAGARVGPHDRVVWAGEEWEVDGDVGDWTAGPWLNPVAGVTLNLTRVEG